MEDCKKTPGRISESEIAKRLLMKYFDGVVLVDLSDGALIQVSDFLTGKLKNVLSHDKVLYEDQVNAIIDRKIPDAHRNAMKAGMSLATIREELKSHPTYNVDFQTAMNGDGVCAYKRICYEYLDEKKDLVIAVCEDTSDIITNEIDPLTGLYNSTGFHNRVQKWIAENPGRKYRIVRYNIDRFKDINGIYGYSMGNRLLRDVGYHMKRNDTQDSFSAHLNADHFIRFCSDDSLSPQEYYDDFVSGFSGYALKIPISIHAGVYNLCEPDCNSFTMSYKALLALQFAKGSFSKHIVYYEKGMMGVEMEHQELLKDVDRAIENEEFEVWFQPQVDYLTHTLTGAEALIRWRHPERGLIQPGVFIPLLEHSDYITAVDRYMIDRTCRYMRKWMDKMPGLPVIVSVNLSRNDIYDPGCCEMLKEIIGKYNIPIENLRLEITESACVDNAETIVSVINRLRAEGFITEMDDFGSGYSSLNSLKDIDIDILKLDMKFLAGNRNTEKSKIIISSMINMASALGLPVIAEGVETREQAAMLLDFGCRNMQGYYFSRPVPADEYEKILLKIASAQ